MKKEFDLPKLIVDVTKGMTTHEKKQFERALIEAIPQAIVNAANQATSGKVSETPKAGNNG